MERTHTVIWEDPSSIQKATHRLSGLEVMEAIRALTVDRGEVPCEGTIIHMGWPATVEAKVHDRQGVLYAHGTSTCLQLRSKANPTGEVAS